MTNLLPGNGRPIVVLVDAYASSRLFLRDETFRGLGGRIEALGGTALLFDWIRDETSPGHGFPDLLGILQRTQPDFVLLARAWSERLIQQIRAATPRARLLRFSRGAPAAHDELFDGLVEGEAFLSLITGEEDPVRLKWRRSKDELRQPPPEDAPQPGSRPSISGPARGCPFLVDIRSNPAWQNLGVDPESVQSKGCAFCLDNVGAYAAFPDDEIVESWIRQLRVIREKQPSAREVLLTDEHPHPLLPQLFQGILAEPALHGLEILIKSRVDWLAESADSHLAEACRLAARSHSVLHLYLVGFESFHQPDLDLFNKTATVAENLAAVSILKRLESSFPSSFEFRRHRAHGIVLFHPWTTPEGLLENARHMREVDFHELRAQALRTRLRLYPSVPLHALAARQELLTDSFSEGRGDRAEEQGYDASVPWHFADSRIEAIFQAANQLADALPGIEECDILEMAVRFVQRWPAFAAAPHLAALPILQAVYTWGPAPRELLRIAGPKLATFDREVEEIVAGRKLACLKEGVPLADAANLVEAYQVMGLSAAVCSTHARGGADGRHGPGHSHAIVAVAATESVLKEVLEEQQGVESGKGSRIPAMGQFMGYPACCTAAFAEQQSHGDNLALERLPFQRHPDRPLSPLLNRIGPLSLVSHILCSPDCSASVELARARIDRLRSIDPAAAYRIEENLKRPVLRLDYARAAFVRGTWEEDRFRIAEFHPFADNDIDLRPESVRGVRFPAPRFVLLDFADGSSEEFESPGPLLVEPGSPVGEPLQRMFPPETSLPLSTPLSTGEESLPLGGSRSEAPVSSASLDELRARLQPGTSVGPFVIDLCEEEGARGLRVRLSRPPYRMEILLQPWSPERPSLSRRGPWGLDVPEGVRVTDAHRAMIGALARRIPAGQRRAEPSGEKDRVAPPSPIRAGAKPVTPKNAATQEVPCTAPWTTLEVVDPDGRVRQCCGDWTVGDRGNLHVTSLAEVWNGAGYQFARRIMGGADLTSLCRTICPRLYDFKFAESVFLPVHGAPRFEENQRLLAEDIAARREVVRGKPLFVAVCPSTYCNYDCIMCLHGRSPRRELPDSIWDELLELLPTLRVLTLLGGEPLANPRAMQFLRNWNRDKTPDASVSIVTNGSLLTPAVLTHLEACRFGSVTVSLNAGTDAVYERVQRGVPLASVLRNVEALLDRRRRLSEDFPVVLSFVVQPANHETLLPFGDIARRRGLPIRLMPLSPRGPEGLDFYEDEEQVAAILTSLDSFHAWARSTAPEFCSEILATRTAIAREAASRHPAPLTATPVA